MVNWRAGMFAVALTFGSASAEAASAPRVLSLDYCADQYVLALADRTQIVGLSREATMVHSFYRTRASGLPQAGGSAEEVLRSEVDVVVRTWGGDHRLLGHLTHNGIEVLTAPYEEDATQVSENLRAIGRSVGQEERGAQLARALERRAQRLSLLPEAGFVAAYLNPGGVTAGQGTTVDAVLKLAGFDTLGEVYGLNGWVSLPLERMVGDPPDVLVTSFFDQPNATASHWSLSRHHAVRSMMQDVPVIDVPGRYLSCNGLFMVEAAEFVRAEASRRGLIKTEESP